jgi:hypothetical protein
MSTITTVLLIMNCERYIFKAERQLQTWIPRAQLNDEEKGIVYYHVRGNVDLPEAWTCPLPHVIIVRAPDTYIGLPQKVRAAFAAARALHPEANWIFKTDDDQCLTHFSLLHKLQHALVKHAVHYGGYIVNVVQPYLSDYSQLHPELPAKLPILPTKYCSGRFYFLSSQAVDALLALGPEVFGEHVLEDYAIGRLLPDAFKQNMMFIPTNKFFTDIY